MLRDLREAAGLTQRALAEKLGGTHLFVHKSETGSGGGDVTEFIDWCVACGADPVKVFRSLRDLRRV